MVIFVMPAARVAKPLKKYHPYLYDRQKTTERFFKWRLSLTPKKSLTNAGKYLALSGPELWRRLALRVIYIEKEEEEDKTRLRA